MLDEHVSTSVLRASPKEIGQRVAQALQVQGVPVEVATSAARLVEDTELLLGSGLRGVLEEIRGGVFREPRGIRVEQEDVLRLEGEWPTLLAFGELLAPALAAWAGRSPLCLGPVRCLEWVDALAARFVRRGLSGRIRWAAAGTAPVSTAPTGAGEPERDVAWFDAAHGEWGVDRGGIAEEGTLTVHLGDIGRVTEERIGRTGSLDELGKRRAAAQRDGFDVSAAAWAEVCGIAARVLIPTSARSRLGAG